MRRGTCTRLLALSLLLSSATARSQPQGPDADAGSGAAAPLPEPPQEATPKQQARALLHEGLEHFGNSEPGVALAKFRQAYAIYPSPKLLLNIGTALRHLGKNAEAAESYRAYLADPHADPQQRPELQRILNEIDLLVGRLVLLIDDTHASVRIDGRPIDVLEARTLIRVDPGEHTISANRGDGLAAVQTVRIGAQEEMTVSLSFVTPKALPPEIRVVREQASPQPIIGLAIGGVGLAGLAIGGVFGGLALSAHARAKDDCSSAEPSVCDDRGAALGATARNHATVSTVAFVAGGVLLGTGIVVFATSPDDSKQPSSEARFSLSAQPGATFRWTW